MANYLTRAVNSKPGASLDKPKLMPFPGASTSSGADRKKALFAGIRAAQAEAKATDTAAPDNSTQDGGGS